MTPFDYHIEFLPLTYCMHTRSFLIFKTEEPSTEPDIHAFLQHPEHQARLAQLGHDGWELVSVQPALRGHIQIGNQNAQGWAYGLALPTGYLLFFKRPLPPL
ncbi:hypothetical protein C5U62_30010 [Pseudomonas protegens]|uniref:DUF4177 domain-containing protein n=1 Tax=Pseudomonas protegens TaxID=380021 RepID=A0A2T6GD44_9PSED|nr:hypothetical protein [Pseudomonas protegens]PUA42075.1 hypothetical protein C5U62_30010 [Pseudomonas protegens]